MINLAGLQKIDNNIYEAALIDGASSWVVFWKITLPSMKRILLLGAIYSIVLMGTSEINEVIILIRENMLNPSTGFGIAAAMAWLYAVSLGLIMGVAYLIFGRNKKIRSDAYVGQKRIMRNVDIQTAKPNKRVLR